jgi:membrane protein CcdC involved in cytochrome C biogenesis
VKKYAKNAYIFLGLGTVSVVMHNVVSALIHKEEGVFFVLTFVFMVIFIVSLVYNVIYLKGKNK